VLPFVVLVQGQGDEAKLLREHHTAQRVQRARDAAQNGTEVNASVIQPELAVPVDPASPLGLAPNQDNGCSGCGSAKTILGAVVISTGAYFTYRAFKWLKRKLWDEESDGSRKSCLTWADLPCDPCYHADCKDSACKHGMCKNPNCPVLERVRHMYMTEKDVLSMYMYRVGLKPLEDADKGLVGKAYEFVSDHAIALGALAGGAVAYQHGHLDRTISRVTGYLGNCGAMGVTAVCAVVSASGIGLKYAYDYFMGEKVEDPKKADVDVATKDADKSAKKEDKKEGEKKSNWMLYSAIAALFAAFVWFLPAISAFFGLQGSLGAVTGPITSGKGAVLGLLGMAPAGGLLPAP